MDFTNRPFRDEWLNPGEPKPEQTMPADGGTPPEEAPGPTPRAALTAARGVAPESLTLTQWLSKELVLPEQLVRQTPQQALEELRARQLESNPHLAAWAGKSVQNAAHARENVEYLNRFRDAFADFDAAYRPQKEQSFAEFMAEFMDSLGKPGEKLLHAVTNDVPEVAQNVGRVLTHGMADVNAGVIGSALAVAENVFGVDSAPARWARSARDWADWARPEKVQADTALGQFGYDALRIAPQMAATIAAGVANPVAAAGVMGSQIFGSSYNELRGKGVSPLPAALNAGANTAMQLPMERFGLEKLLRAIRTTGTKEALKNWIGAALSEGLTEGAQKAPEFVTHLWAEAERQGGTTGERVDWFAKQVTDADNLMQATREAVYEGLLGGVWGGAFGGVGAVRSFRQERNKKPDALAGLLAMPEIREALTAEAEQATVMAQRQGLGNALTQAASELEGAPATNDPAAMREMTEAVLPEQFRQAWIGPDDAVRLFQEAQARGEGEAAALLETLGTDEAGLAQAAEQGDVLPVSTAAVLAQLKGEGRAAVMDALRVTPDGVSGTEAAAYDPEARAEKLVRSVLGMEEESDDGGRDAGDALREARSAQKVRADVAREITRITQEIEAAGYPRHAAQTFARLLEHEAITAHTVYGVDPVSFILQRVSVARGQQTADGRLGQAAMYPARDPDLSSFISRVREEARGEKSSYFVLTGEGIPEDAEVRVTSDLIRHQGKRHPDMTLEDNEKLPAIVAGIDGENTYQVGGRWPYGTRFKGMQEIDGTTYGYVFDIAPNGTVSFVTFFKDWPEGIRDWYLRPEKKKKKASNAPVERAEARIHASSLSRWQAFGKKASKMPVERAEARTNDSSLPLGKPSEKRLSDFIAEVKENGPELFQRAYHGTPHRFDQFTLDHIGSGEGAQVHGWGLYFAADKNISEQYRESLANSKFYVGDRELHGDEAWAAMFLLDAGGNKRPLAEVEADIKNRTESGPRQDQILEHVRNLHGRDISEKAGQLYEVDIPENEELLDEQKTLAEQPGAVREALERGSDLMPDDEAEASMAEYLYQALEDGGNVTGRDLYEALSVLGTENYEERLEVTSAGARAASEFLNSLGIKGITYEGRQDGRCFVIFDDKAISILNTFYQTRKPVEVRSATLGVPEGGSIRDYIKAAKKYHDQLKHESEHGRPVIQPELNKPVRFSKTGWDKNVNSGADSRKWKLFPYLREIIETSRLVRTEKPQGKHEGFNYAHWLENEVILDGQPLTVGFTLLEDANGNLFYNIAADISDTSKAKAPRGFRPGAQSPDPKELHQDGNPSVEKTITTDADGVNLTLREATPGGIRGSVTLSPKEAAIRVFADKDLSTVPHEAAHIFLDDLMRIAADDGSLALDNMRAALEGVLPRMGEEMRAEILAAVDAAPKATPETLAEALHDAATGLRARAQDARATARLNRETARELRREAGVAEDYKAPAGERSPWDEFETEARLAGNDAADFTRAANIVARAAAHVRALEQARRDLAELREWAGLAPDAELAPGTEEYTRFHEAVARGFEQYLMEGKAPSRKLEGVFSRLRQWLLRIYAAAREQPGLAINDNVRRVFDRMLATDAEVRQQQGLRRTMQAEREFADSGLLYFDELEALNALRNEAERAVTAEMDRATLRERNKRFRAYYSDALRDLEASPFWEMVGALSKREKSAAGDASIGGINKEGVVRLLGPAAAADLARARPGLLNAKGHGLPVDLAAMEYGYEDEDALVHDLYDALVVRGESKQKLARALAEQRLAEDDSAAEADALLHGSESYAAYLDKVDEVVARMAYARGLRTREEQARRVRNLITPRSVVQHWAWEELQHTRLADMRPERYQARLDKALRDRSRALADGNAMQAVNAVQEARMANELIHLSREFLQRRDKLVTLAKATAAAKAGTFPPLHTAALRKLLGRFGLGTMRGGVDPVLATFSLRELVQKTVAEEDVEGVAPSFADWLLNGINPATGISLGNGTLRLGGLTPFEMEEVENLLKYLRHAGYNERAEARKSEAAKVQLLEDAAVAAMRELPDAGNAPAHSLRRGRQQAGHSLYAAVDSLRWEMRKADGFQNVDGQGEAGPMEQMFNEMLAGEERARARVGQISRDMAPHMVHLSQSVAAWEKKYGKHLMLKGQDGKPVKLPESLDKAYGKGWTADMVLALALNCGNDSNMARLVTGYPDLSYDTLAEILGDAMATRAFNAARGAKDAPRGNRHGLLSAADWQAVQGIWDALATQWDDTQKVHERMFGFRPKGVEAAPFRVADADGTVVSLRGGYYPVRYDPNVSQQVAQWGEKEDLLSRNESLFAVPAAKRGHTQARSERAPGLPMRLNTGIIMEHINDVVRLIELGEITRRADRVTQGAAFRAEYIRAFGKEDYEAIRPNLRGLVRQEPPPKSDWAVASANFVRRYLVPWGLAWNIKVAALQMTAVFPAMGDLGGGPMLRSMAHMARHPLAIRDIWAVSPYMKSRMNNIDQDLQRNIANFNPGKRPASLQVGGKEIAWDDVVNLGMMPIVAVDATATAAVWMAAYTKKLSTLQGAKDVRYGINTESEFHDEAVAFADSMVKQSNPDYDPSSRSGFLRAQNAYRLLNGFASAVTLFAARHKYMYTARKKGKITRWQLARFELYETLLPAVAMFLFLALARGYWGDKDEPEDIAKLAIGSLADFATMRVPIFGSAVGDGLLNIMGLGDGGRQGGLRTTIDEPFRQIATLTGRVGQVVKKGMKGEQVKNLSYAVGDVLSFAARVPVSKLARNAERGYDQWQRGQGTAFSVLMPRPGK